MKNANLHHPSQNESQQERERFQAALTRIVQRTRNNKEEALNYLRSVGYFELMADQEKEQTK